MAFRIKMFADDSIRVPVGAVVVALTFLVLDHLLFLGDRFFGHGVDKEAHLVGFCPEHLFEAVVRHDLKVVRAIAVGRAVQGSAKLVDQNVEPARTQVFRIEEHEMLEQVSEPRLAGPLARRADVVRRCDGRDRVRSIDVQDDIEAVVERVFLVLDGKCRRGAGCDRGVGRAGHENKDRQHERQFQAAAGYGHNPAPLCLRYGLGASLLSASWRIRRN